MKITGVRVSCHNVPLDLPRLEEPVYHDCVVVRVETDEGITGLGFTSRQNRFAIREFIHRELSPLLAGKDPLETEGRWEEMFWHIHPRSLAGVTVNALSAIDIALWDLKGKYLGQPVYRLLGGFSPRVPVYATFGVLAYSREDLVAVAQQRVGEGHDKLKMVVAIDRGQNIPEDVARVRTVWEAVGEGVQLMVDANHLFNLSQARELARRLEPYDLTWFEEPVENNDVADLAALRAYTSIPIAAGQQEGLCWRHRDLIVGGGVDIAQTDAVYVGGFSEALKVAHLAAAYNRPLATHGWPHINMHLVGAVANGWRVEFHAGPTTLAQTIFANPTRPEGGWVTIPERPGLGIELNEDALREYEG